MLLRLWPLKVSRVALTKVEKKVFFFQLFDKLDLEEYFEKSLQNYREFRRHAEKLKNELFPSNSKFRGTHLPHT